MHTLFLIVTCYLLPPSASLANPNQIPTKSHFSPILRNGPEAKEKRRRSEPGTEAQRIHNGTTTEAEHAPSVTGNK